MSLIRQVVEAVQASGGVIDLNALSRKLEIQPKALEGILAFCARKGYICLETEKAQGCASCAVVEGCGVKAGRKNMG